MAQKLLIGFLAASSHDIQSSRHISKGEKSVIKKIIKSDEEWKKILTPEQFMIMRKAGTERPFTGKYNDHYEKGTYLCAGCGSPLFRSDTKYDHGTGWPSFTAPVDDTHIDYAEDNSLGTRRIEVRCAVCGAHLGHVFDDGPPPAYKHYCINSVTLSFKSENSQTQPSAASNFDTESDSKKTSKLEKAIFAAGCFCRVEYKFSQIKGVVSTSVGYTGGTTKNPSYKQVCTGETGHAEAVHIEFDPSHISYSELLEAFFSLHDPTQLNRQGPDIGTQYRSVIYYFDEEQKKAAEEMIKNLNESGRFSKPLVTHVVPASEFYKAEEYHQKFYDKNLNRSFFT